MNAQRPTPNAQLHDKCLVFLGYIGMLRMTVDGELCLRGIGERLDDTFHFDTIRMREGGVDAVMLTLAGAGLLDNPDHKVIHTLREIDRLMTLIERNSPELGFARNASEVRQLRSEGRLAIMLHMTCSAQLAGDLAMLRIYHGLGLKSLHFSADAAGDSETPADDDVGLRPFGVELVREMDRLGMPIDVSHSSDKAFRDIMELSQGTVYASHSNCRALSNARRNVPDDMIRAVAERGGVVGMHFASGLCDYKNHEKHMHLLSPYVTEVQVLTRELHAKYPNPWDFQKAFLDPAQNPGFDPNYLDKFGFPPPVSFEKMVDHIDHVCALVGPDHVALGSDWYGGQTSMLGLEHIGKMPAVTKELVRRGYSREDVEKIMGGNWLRIFE